MTPEQAAEECSQKWVITAIKPIGQPAYDLPSDVIKDIKYRLKQAFLAGHSFALRPIDGSTSDGYHTFDELYEHRILLYLMCVETGAFKASYVVEDHFDGWDLIVAFTPGNYQQISYHVPNRYRPIYKKAPRKTKEEQEKLFDGHDSKLVAHRIEMALRHLDCIPPTPQGER